MSCERRHDRYRGQLLRRAVASSAQAETVGVHRQRHLRRGLGCGVVVTERQACDDCGMRSFLPITLAFLLPACASQQVVDGFVRVEPGMTKDEVVSLLGKPSSTWPLSQKFDGMQGTRLQWGDGLSSLASSAAFRGDPERAYSVVFDDKGVVVSKAAPRWVEEELAEDEVLRERRIDRENNAAVGAGAQGRSN